MIYFVRSGNKFVKIGTTDNLSRRLHELQTGSPLPLKLMATLNGSFSTEASLHSLFSKYRYNREWFKLSDEIKWFIRTIQINPNMSNIKSIYMESQKLRLLEKANRLGKNHKLTKRIRGLNS